jgi:hypothetical protein
MSKHRDDISFWYLHLHIRMRLGSPLIENADVGVYGVYSNIPFAVSEVEFFF